MIDNLRECPNNKCGFSNNCASLCYTCGYSDSQTESTRATDPLMEKMVEALEHVVDCLGVDDYGDCVLSSGFDYDLIADVIQEYREWKHVAQAEIDRLEDMAEKMAEALEDLIERANRGRGWLQNAPSGGNWGIFDTETAKQALQEYREGKDAK